MLMLAMMCNLVSLLYKCVCVCVTDDEVLCVPRCVWAMLMLAMMCSLVALAVQVCVCVLLTMKLSVSPGACGRC